jgi:hypothetical protein
MALNQNFFQEDCSVPERNIVNMQLRVDDKPAKEFS